MRILVVIVAASLAVALDAGCKDEGMQALTRIRDKACAWHDLTCIEEVQQELGKVAKLHVKDPDKAKALGGEIIACVMKATEESMGKAPEEVAGQADERVEALLAVKHVACACRGEPCAKAASDDLDAAEARPTRDSAKAALIASEITACLYRATSGSAQPAEMPVVAEGAVTTAHYELIKEGMTYAAVEAILGEKGEPTGSSQIGGIQTVMYSWNAKSAGATVTAMFQNDKLVGKAQFGLK